MKIFLFDMDGVLLEAQGYHRALQETLRRMTLALGFEEATVSAGVIAAFEAAGVSSEWDEAAIITARLLERVWQDEPERGLPDSLADPLPLASPPRPLPDLAALARAFSTPAMLPLHPLERAGRFFLRKPGRTALQEQTLHDLILGARLADLSLAHRTFQELVLGSQEYARVYDFPPEHHCESYLLTHDRPTLSQAAAQQLCEWIAAPGHAAAVITSRPSRAPAGVFSTPEAELGARLVGLENIPIAGWGGLCWLGLQTHISPQSFLKPSPVHALAGMRMALGAGQEIALKEAADLAENGLAGPDWHQLRESEISVFEDTPGGVQSLQAAVRLLEKGGVPLRPAYYGIAREPVKLQALEACSARVFASLADALEAVCKE